jgi:hypothetical protein
MDPHPPIQLMAELERLGRALQHPRATGVWEPTLRPSSYTAGPPRPTRTRRSPLDRLHAYAREKRRTQRRLIHAGSLGLDPARYPAGSFGPQHGLTPAQASEANRLLARANHLRPIRGRHAPQRSAARIGGIISAVLGSRVGNGAFGRSLHGHRGGRVMAIHALHHLRTIAPLGALAAKAAREGKKVLKAWEAQQAGVHSYEAWQRELGEGLQQEQPPRDLMAW